ESCVAGTCTVAGACGPGQTDCNGVCVDLQRNVFHCGVCNQNCGPFTTCNAGMCECIPGWDDCAPGVMCDTNIAFDSANCGGCGIACGTAEVCTQGMCQC